MRQEDLVGRDKGREKGLRNALTCGVVMLSWSLRCASDHLAMEDGSKVESNGL